MRNEQDVSTPPASNDVPSQTAPAEPAGTPQHAPWEVARLILALVVCALIVGAALAYEKLG